MPDMSPEATALLKDMSTRLTLIETRMGALPDKAEVYKAALAVHALVWGTMLGTVAGLKAFGVF